MSKQKYKRKPIFKTIYKFGSDLLKSQMFLLAKDKLFGSSPELFAVQAKVERLEKGLTGSEEIVRKMSKIRSETVSIIEASKQAVGSTPDAMGTVLTSVRLEEIYARVDVVESELNAVLNPSAERKQIPSLTRRISQIITPQYPKRPNISNHEMHDKNIERIIDELVTLRRRKSWVEKRLTAGASRKMSGTMREKISETKIKIEAKETRIKRIKKKKTRLDDENDTFESRNESARKKHIKSIVGYATAISKVSEKIDELALKEQVSAEKRAVRRTKNLSRDSTILKELLWEKRASDITKALALSAMILIPTALISNKTFDAARDAYCRSRDTGDFDPSEGFYGKKLSYRIDRDLIFGFDGQKVVMKLKLMFVPPLPFHVSIGNIPIILPTGVNETPLKPVLIPMFLTRAGSNRSFATFIPIRGSFEDFDITRLSKNIKVIHVPYTESPVCRPGTKRCLGLRRIEFHNGKPVDVGDIIVELIPKKKKKKGSKSWHLCSN